MRDFVFPLRLQRSLRRLLLAAVFILTSAAAPGFAEVKPSANITPPARQEAAYAKDSLLVRFKPATSFAQKQNARALVNGETRRFYGLVQGLEQLQIGQGQGVEKAIQVLQQLPFVDYAEPDFLRYPDTNDTYYDLQWGLENNGQEIRGVQGLYDADIDAEEAWTMTTGDPAMVVAVIDTGVEYTHEDLDGNSWVNPGEIAGDNIDNDGNGYIDDIYGWDFFASDNDPMDEDGHGTHVSGTICAEGNNGIGVSGVAWQCQVMALRFIGPDGGYTSDAIAALDYAVAQGVKASNNSWGGGGYSQALYDAIQNAAAFGHLFVAAAGNGGSDGIGDDTDSSPHYPSSYDLPSIIAVAATDNRDRLADFSNYGATSVDLGAPGVDIASTMLSSYYWSGGTSMAAPHVSGAAALLLGVHPDWTHTELKERLLNTARPIAALDGITVTGGVANTYAALQEAAVSPSSASSLYATAVSEAQIDLTWTDNSDNEEGFRIERSLDSANWEQIASVGQNATSYSDTALSAETTYYYRIKAYNSAGESDYSNTASATTDSAPTSQQAFANSETSAAGTVNGNHEDTWTDDGISESITERESGGKPTTRHSYLEHTWAFEVPPGSTSLHLNAWADASQDGDSFNFSYSLDGNQFTDVFLLSGGGESDWHSYILPPQTHGTVYLRVMDTDRSAGNRDLDTLHVDQMYILSEQDAGDPPLAPSNLSASALVAGEVDLAWKDNATDEYGFEIERSTDNGTSWTNLKSVGVDAQSYTDTAVASQSTYTYRVRAYNGAGYSAYSNKASATTLESAAIELQATGYKVKGWHNVDLTWNESALSVDIYRDGVQIAANITGGAFTDSSIDKGGASYVYVICESGGTSNCSNEVIVNF